MKKLVKLFLSTLLLVGLTSTANALVIFNDWTLNLDSFYGAGHTYTNISSMVYTGIAHGQTWDTNANFIPDAGEYGSTDGLLQSMTYTKTAGGIGLYGGLEVTFDFSINSIGVNPAFLGDNTFTHLASGTNFGNASLYRDGFLDIYVDDAADANKITGNGYTNGNWIARFKILPGGGGVFSSTELDGSDDASFVLTDAVAGVILDKDGVDLKTFIGTSYAIIGITDSNYDADGNNENGIPDSEFGTDIPGFLPAFQTPVDFVAEEDGSARLGMVPEPATMLLLGMGLIGLAGISRKKNQ